MHQFALPNINKILLVLATLFASHVAGAAESCPVKIANLLSAGKAADLSAMFETPAPGTQDELSALAASFVSFAKVVESSKPRFSTYKRLSVKSQGLPRGFTSQVFRADAVSAQIGEVQLQVDVKPGTPCTVLALHIDHPVK